MSIAAAFLGCDHRVGTSMICQSTAEYLAERYIEKKVLVIHAEASFGTDYSPCVSESMEHAVYLLKLSGRNAAAGRFKKTK